MPVQALWRAGLFLAGGSPSPLCAGFSSDDGRQREARPIVSALREQKPKDRGIVVCGVYFVCVMAEEIMSSACFVAYLRAWLCQGRWSLSSQSGSTRLTLAAERGTETD